MRAAHHYLRAFVARRIDGGGGHRYYFYVIDACLLENPSDLLENPTELYLVFLSLAKQI
jgi:hypothetical protein